MKKIILKIFIPAIAGMLFFTSCNKSLPDAVPITTTLNALTINNFLKTDTAYTFYNTAVIKVGGAYSTLLSDSSGATSVTVFAPNNNAFRAAGYLTTTAVSNIRLDSLTALVAYTIIPGHEYVYTDIPTTFPNIQLPTSFSIGLLPGTTIPFKLTGFPSRRATGFWYNATTVTSFDAHYRNGVVHALGGLIFPISPVSASSSTPIVMAQLIYGDPQFSLFSAMIARGDQNPANPALVDGIIKNAGANLTLFAPTNTAVKAFISTASGGAIPANAADNDPRYSGFINGSLPTLNAQGIVLYHFLGVRAFSVNFSSAAAPYPTLVPGANVSVQSFFKPSNLAVVDSMKIIGNGNFGQPTAAPPATSKPASNFDKFVINGVVHIIDRVLQPQ